MYVSISVSQCLSANLSFCLFVAHCLFSLSVCLSVVFLYLSVSFFLFPSLCFFCLSICCPDSLSLCISACLYVWLSVEQPLSLCCAVFVSLSLFICCPQTLFLYASITDCLSPYLLLKHLLFNFSIFKELKSTLYLDSPTRLASFPTSPFPGGQRNPANDKRPTSASQKSAASRRCRTPDQLPPTDQKYFYYYSTS